MPLKSGTQCAQTAMHGLGRHFESPKHPRDKKKNQALVHVPGEASIHRHVICVWKPTQILCLLFDHSWVLLWGCDRPLTTCRFISIGVPGCKCPSVAQVLVHFGLFPTAPSQPYMAVSVDLLGFYWSLFDVMLLVLSPQHYTLTMFGMDSIWSTNR